MIRISIFERFHCSLWTFCSTLALDDARLTRRLILLLIVSIVNEGGICCPQRGQSFIDLKTFKGKMNKFDLFKFDLIIYRYTVGTSKRSTIPTEYVLLIH
jgi:hypothetical protein